MEKLSHTPKLQSSIDFHYTYFGTISYICGLHSEINNRWKNASMCSGLCLSYYIILIKRISTPHAKTTNPTMEIANPFTVHSGMLYIKEDCGPNTELLCATNTIPAIIRIHPTTINILTKVGFLILMQMPLKCDPNY